MMRIIVVGCVSVLLGMGTIQDLTAQADETNKERSTEVFCKEMASEYPVNQDSCVVCVNAGDSVPECLCDNIAEKDMHKDGRLENHPQCVKMFTHMLEGHRATD